jgi:hypothetical protein
MLQICRPILLAVLAVSMSGAGRAADCTIVDEKTFAGDAEGVRLSRLSGLGASANFAAFRAPLAVNTDGAPNSYHPLDPLGRERAINRFDNGIAIRRNGGGSMTTAQRIEVFERWRDGDWVVPSGFSISWQNVIAKSTTGKPCVFQSGPFKGYFGSLTALQNGLPEAQAGECGVSNQLDQRDIPAIVLRGADNPLKEFGARKGDLVVAVNPQNGTATAAIIGDVGDGKRIGEGSVALNMILLGVSEQPKTFIQAATLDTGSKAMALAVLPGTRNFEVSRPVTRESLGRRVELWLDENGYADFASLSAAVLECTAGL